MFGLILGCPSLLKDILFLFLYLSSFLHPQYCLVSILYWIRLLSVLVGVNLWMKSILILIFLKGNLIGGPIF